MSKQTGGATVSAEVRMEHCMVETILCLSITGAFSLVTETCSYNPTEEVPYI